MQGFGGLLRLVPITVEALLSVTTAALSGFGVFFRVSFGLGHDALLRIVIISRPDIKETRSHLVSISSLQTSGDAPVAMRAHKPFIMHHFHGVPSGRQGQFSLKFTFGKARVIHSLRPSGDHEAYTWDHRADMSKIITTGTGGNAGAQPLH